MKADFKEKLKKTDNTDLKMLNQKLKDQLAIQLAAGELQHQEVIKQIKQLTATKNLLSEKTEEAMLGQKETRTKLSVQMKSLET